jgi:hypothetical protein
VIPAMAESDDPTFVVSLPMLWYSSAPLPIRPGMRRVMEPNIVPWLEPAESKTVVPLDSSNLHHETKPAEAVWETRITRAASVRARIGLDTMHHPFLSSWMCVQANRLIRRISRSGISASLKSSCPFHPYWK